jgi:predicted component of type VI protein secretion system
MPFLPASRTKRNLLKVASLGLAGLLAGLLAGCNDSPDTTVSVTVPNLSTESLNPDAGNQAEPTALPQSLDATQIPALHRPPTSRSLRYGTVQNVSMNTAPGVRSRS